jgi:hypothetical protein
MSEQTHNTVSRDYDDPDSHGFYYSALTDDERPEYDRALGVKGLDHEIALLRVKTKSLAIFDPRNIALIVRALKALESLIKTKCAIFKEDAGQHLREVMTELMNQLPPELRAAALRHGLEAG